VSAVQRANGRNSIPKLKYFCPYRSVQVVIQVLNFLMTFVLFSGTYLFEVGLIGVLIKEFRLIFVVIPLYAVVYLAFMGCKLVRIKFLHCLERCVFWGVVTISIVAAGIALRKREICKLFVGGAAVCVLFCYSETWWVPIFFLWRTASINSAQLWSWSRNAVALIYYLFVFDTVTRIGEMQWYQKGPWVARYAAGQQHLLVSGRNGATGKTAVANESNV
jgi:hypothetical protein